MRILKKEENIMVELNPEFQNKLFTQLLNKMNSIELSKLLGKSSSIVYHYKNNFVRAIPKIVVERAIKLSNFSKKDLSKKIVKTFSAKDSIRKILDKGIEARRKQLKKEFSIDFGAHSQLEVKGNFLSLDVLNWLNKNLWIKKLQNQTGLLKNVKTEEDGKEIFISYSVYNRAIKNLAHYKISLPKIIKLDNDFCYFLGLLYGDGLNGARVGIVNKDTSLIKWTSNFLKNIFNNNKIKGQLTLHNKNLEEDFTKQVELLRLLCEDFVIYHNKGARGDYVYNLFITNNILRRILDDFLDNLENLFIQLNFNQKGSFLAGFFDAEGNVNKLDRNLRFSQKIENKVNIIQNILKKERYHTRYDGSNILIGYKKEYKGDLKLFKEQILPFLKHSTKTKQVEELLNGYLVREEYKPLLQIILQNPGITQKQIAKKIGRIKCNGKLFALSDAGFVDRIRKRVDESFKYAITDKGLEYLEKK